MKKYLVTKEEIDATNLRLELAGYLEVEAEELSPDAKVLTRDEVAMQLWGKVGDLHLVLDLLFGDEP